MVYISLFAALITICSWISIPATVPFTLQTMAVFTAVGLLGGRRGTISVLLYILLGAFGLPGFAWNHRWIYYWLFIYSIMYVGNREAFWTITGCSCYFHGGGTTCMLCIWNCMVHAGISTFHRCCELDDGTWLVCHSIFDTRCNKNRIGIFLIECVKKVR